MPLLVLYGQLDSPSQCRGYRRKTDGSPSRERGNREIGEENMQKAHHARGWYFLPKLTFVITIGLITAATGFKAAPVGVFTDPVGFITLTAEGTAGPGGSPAYSFQGLGMTAIGANRGAITGIATTTITVNNTLTANAFNPG